MYIFVIIWIFLQVIHMYRNKYGKINNCNFKIIIINIINKTYETI